MKNNTKQVLVWRSDLRTVDGHKVRSGKMAAQLAHASMKAILEQGHFEFDETEDGLSTFILPMQPDMEEWLGYLFTKICVKVDSLEELIDIYKQARLADIPRSLVEDAGLTEFNNVPTITACAIGPARNDIVDKITGHLKLL